LKTIIIWKKTLENTALKITFSIDEFGIIDEKGD
jgi:hypothetical protein